MSYVSGKVIEAKVIYDYFEFAEPNQRFGNDPEVKFTVEGESPPFLDYRYEERNGCYFAQQDQNVNYIYKADPEKPDQGFGGRTFTAHMKDGSVRTWKGGWSSRPAAMTQAANFPMVFHCAIRWTEDRHPDLYYATNVTLEYAHEAIERLLPEWEMYVRCAHDEILVGVKRKDRPPKNPQRWSGKAFQHDVPHFC